MLRVASQAHTADPRFPIGRTRLETAGVVGCAVIMTLSTIEVIQSAGWDLYKRLLQRHGSQPAKNLPNACSHLSSTSRCPAHSEVVTGG